MSIVTNNAAGARPKGNANNETKARSESGGNGRMSGRLVVSHGVPEEEFLVCTFRCGKITERVVTTEEVPSIDPKDVCFHWDTVFGQISIQPQRGQRLEHFGRIPRIGDDVSEPLLRRMMFSPGRMLCKSHWAQDPSLAHLDGNMLSARIYSLRMAFKDAAKVQWFFITMSHPFRIGWNRKRSWRYIEAVVQPAKCATPGDSSSA